MKKNFFKFTHLKIKLIMTGGDEQCNENLIEMEIKYSFKTKKLNR